ncbi:predicted protein [Postia placenta Mad-698-R]|nr:predicted protein [Postia placenta Mad-698-R]
MAVLLSPGLVPIPSPWIKQVYSKQNVMVVAVHPPPCSSFRPTEWLMQERLDKIMNTVPDGFLTAEELNLMVYIVDICQEAIAWTDAEREVETEVPRVAEAGLYTWGDKGRLCALVRAQLVRAQPADAAPGAVDNDASISGK